MSHERRVDPTVAIELLFKGKDNQGFGDVFAQQLDPVLAPGPKLRAHVVDDRYAAMMHLASYPPVEGGRVDDYREIRTALAGFRDELVESAVNLGEMTEDLGKAD